MHAESELEKSNNSLNETNFEMQSICKLMIYLKTLNKLLESCRRS